VFAVSGGDEDGGAVVEEAVGFCRLYKIGYHFNKLYKVDTSSWKSCS
jgi:hypothetical protein